MMKKNFKNKEGSLMIESMVAASLVVVGLLGLFNLIYNSTMQDSLVIHQLQATYLAAEGIEVIKNISDANVVHNNPWNSNLDGCHYVSYDADLSSFAAAGSISFATSPSGDGVFAPQNELNLNGLSSSPTVFSRKVCVNTSDGTYMAVTSVVSWSERGRNESVTLADLLYNWRQ